MATRKINYKDKSPLQTKPEIPEENKVNASDLNEIKEVVNNNADEIELRQLKEEGKGLSENDFTDALKTKLEGLNNYNDTEIKKEISEINKKVAENTENDIKQDNEILELKTNYTKLQEQNTKLESQIKKDRENMINLEVEGQSIHIEDSSDLEGKLEVLGNVEQDVREGYNLYDYMSKAISTAKGLTVTKDTENGYLIVNGTPEVSYLSVCNSMEITDILKDKATYTLWQEKYDNKLYLQVVGTKKDGTGNTHFFSASQKTAFTVDKSKYRRYAINIQIGLTTQAGTFNNYKNRYMLYEGTEEKPYEPYGASPSPEYPSTVRAVGDNINLLENTAKTQIINGVEFTVNPDKTIKINGTATENISTDITKNFAITEQSIFSGMCDGYGYNKMLIQIQGTDYNVNIPNSTLQVLQPKDNVKVRIYIYAGTSINNAIIRPKIEKGTVATSYSNFGQGSVEIKKQNKNLFDISKYPFTKKVAYASNGQLNYWTGYYGITEYFPIEENSNYVFSNDLNKPITYGLMFYNKNKEFISGIVENTTKFITPKNCKYIRFSIQSDTIPNKVQIEHGDKATEIVEHQEETKILPIQKPMLEGDYFIKEADGWKEVHKLEKKIFNGTERFGNIESTGSVKYFSCYEVLNTYKYLGDNTANYISNCFKNIPVSQRYRNNTFFINSGKNPIFSSNSFSTTEEFKAKLVELYNANNPMYIYYELATPTKLPCTPEQTEILDELDNFQTYKPVTNITTDSIAKLKLKYIADTKTYVDNKTSNLEQQVSVINQLLSTTKTSSVLLDNLQSDIESEVL